MRPLLHSKLPEVNLKSGHLIVTKSPQWVVTVLGSCVAVTMFSPRTRLAAICHAMLPQPRRDAADPPAKSDQHRYVTLVLRAMIKSFTEQAVERDIIEVKLFGGANILQAGVGELNGRGVGSANVIAARQSLKSFNLNIIAENVGGLRGCKIFFNTQTGEVLHKHLAHMHDRLP